MARPYAWIATVWHGISAALLYPAAGFVVMAYSTEHFRGRYIAAMWFAQLFGNVVGSGESLVCGGNTRLIWTGIVLGITTHSGSRATSVPTAVYATVVAIQSLGVFLSCLIKGPTAIRRDNGEAIAIFQLLSWKKELCALYSNIAQPQTLLLCLGLLASQMPFSLLGALNSFFFSARTRALANVSWP
jgi:hypothetical protein